MTIAMDLCGENYAEIQEEEIHYGKSIGKGSFGVVFKATWKGMTVAVKKVETESEVRALENEVQQLARVQNENIILLHGVCYSRFHKCLVMEFADGGSLYHLLHSCPDTDYSLAHGISWLLQCAKAVAYLHAIQPRPILHRDLKPPNLLLTQGRRVLKVCDFGTACELRTNMTDNRGSAAWMAPEVFEGKVYTEKCDVYSWGIILWEVLTRRIPFQDLGNAHRVMWAVYQQQRPPPIRGCPKVLESLMKRCWDHVQTRRPRMEEVVGIVTVIGRFLKGADEPIYSPPSDDSCTDSCMSPCQGSTSGHTSRDVSDISCSNTCEEPSYSVEDRTSPAVVTQPYLWNPRSVRRSSSDESAIATDRLTDGYGHVAADSSASCGLGTTSEVSACVIVREDNFEGGSAVSTGRSDPFSPLCISIPPADEVPPLTHLRLSQMGLPIAVQSPNSPSSPPSPGSPPRAVVCSTVTLRQHITPVDSQAYLRRRSAEVSQSRIREARDSFAAGPRRSTSLSVLEPEAHHRSEAVCSLVLDAHKVKANSDTFMPGTDALGRSGLPVAQHLDGDGAPVEEADLGAYWELLDQELRPVRPLVSCPESMRIFNEHKEMARNYLVLQQELFNLRKQKNSLSERLTQVERMDQLANQRVADKMRQLESKREMLRKNHSLLKTQLEQIRSQQETASSHNEDISNHFT